MFPNINHNILELVCAASQNPSQQNLNEILKNIKLLDNDLLICAIPEIELLLDTWGGLVEENDKIADFILQLSEFEQFANSAPLRNSLILAARKSAPSFLSKSEVVKLSGARNINLPLKEISSRIRKLALLGENNFCAYLIHSNEWVQKKDFDSIMHLVEIYNVITRNSKKIDAAVFISDSFFFRFPPEELLLRIKKNYHLLYEEWKSFLCNNALTQPDNERIRIISLNTFVPLKMNSSEFLRWVNCEDIPERDASSGRAIKHPADARGMAELKANLKDVKNTAAKIAFNAENAHRIQQVIFKNHKASLSRELAVELFQIFAGLFNVANDHDSVNNLLTPFAELVEKTNFEQIKYDLFVSWDTLPVSDLTNLLTALKILKGENFLANLSLQCPLKVISSLSSSIINPNQIVEAYKNSGVKASADLVLWGWKNKKNSEILKLLLDPPVVFSAILYKSELKYRQNSIKELKKHILGNDDFISTLANLAMENSPSALIEAIDENTTLLPQEKQSLFVKLSRKNPDFKTAIENALKNGGVKLAKTLSENRKGLEQIVTSIKSHKEKVLELEDIIQKQIPENSAAIAHARSYGDLRENAEYSAAKERQKFLRKRRAEIERELNSVAAIRFTANDGEPNIITPGREIFIKDTKTNSIRQYFLLGAWDGDPSKGRISSESKLGKILIGKKEGDSIVLDGTEIIIEKVSFLPSELLKELNDE